MKKELGQFFTPMEIVGEMMEMVGDIRGRRICDNSCGDGNFLIAIVKTLRSCYSDDDEFLYSLGNVYGFDIDNDVVLKAIERLNDFIYPLRYDWKIYNCDFLLEYKNYSNYFDIVIGNPPYIVSENMTDTHRNILDKMNFTSKGMKDLYVSFFEMSIEILKEDGIGCLLTPNTYIKTNSGYFLREWFANNRTLHLFDNRKESIDFGDASTYTAISLFSKSLSENLRYKDDKFDLDIDLSEYISKPWYFGNRYSNKISDYLSIKVGIQTGANNIFIHKKRSEDSDYIYIDGFKLERGICRNIIKASKYKSNLNEIVIFPYEKIDGKFVLISEDDLKENYPFVYDYLLNNKEQLLRRDKMKSWYSFTREQGFDFEGKKILAPLISKEPNFAISEDENAVVYGGYYLRGINIKDEELLRILNSEYMSEYIYFMGTDMRGGYKQYNKHVISGMTFEF